MAGRVFTEQRQREIDETASRCVEDMRAIGLEPGDYGDHIAPLVRVDALGRCEYLCNTGTFKIECDDRLDDARTRGVLFHELIHTIPGCLNHSKAFLAGCKMVDETFGTENELRHMHYYMRMTFKVAFHQSLRFVGGVGQRYGLGKGSDSERDLYEVAAVRSDGVRELVGLHRGRTFAADAVEVMGLRYHAAWQRERYPDMRRKLDRVMAASLRKYFDSVEVYAVKVPDIPGMALSPHGMGGDNGMRFEVVGTDGEGFHVLRDVRTGEELSADLLVTLEYVYRRRYLAYEAVVGGGLGRMPNPWMHCDGVNDCYVAVKTLAALVESVWNISDLALEGAVRSRVKAAYRTMEGRLLDAASASQRELEDTIVFAVDAFARLADRRGMSVAETALDDLRGYL